MRQSRHRPRADSSRNTREARICLAPHGRPQHHGRGSEAGNRIWDIAAAGPRFSPWGEGGRRPDEGFPASCSALRATPHLPFGHLLPKGRSGSEAAPLTSALYPGHVTHIRLKPRIHRLSYHIYSLLLDLDELDELDRRLTCFSVDGFNLFSFHRKDRGDGTGRDLGYPGGRQRPIRFDRHAAGLTEDEPA